MSQCGRASVWLAAAVLLAPRGDVAAAPQSTRPVTLAHAVSAAGSRASRSQAVQPAGRRSRRARRSVVHARADQLALPGGDALLANLEGAPALAPFFGALDALAAGADPTKIVRVLQLGDSHTAADIWTGRVRSRLQARFGDAGPGLLLPAYPWRGAPHLGVRQFFSRHWSSTSLRDKAGVGRVGLAGAALWIPEREALRVVGCFRGFEVTTLGRLGLPPGLGLVRPAPDLLPDAVCCAGAADTGAFPELAPSHSEAALKDGAALHFTGQSSIDACAPLEIHVHLAEGDSLLGVDLRSGRSGLLFDELGLNGAEITDIERWDPELRSALLAHARADLIILAYGANDMGRGDLTLEAYREQVANVLRALRAESGAPILVVGPTDRRARRSRPARLVAANAPVVVRALREAAAATGCAFWDARAAMGGEGAIAGWRRHGLARRDFVHLTGAGYQRLGDLMVDTLLAAYEASHPPPVPSPAPTTPVETSGAPATESAE